ncbi:hypothetical protein FLONG3_4699 [Fusarium longipes]|uniref:Uncharacterized protein n=1 Tax=Fusarium longipes TaxID=694270 RepID=A0A395SXH0_9HYPO|nr:hypothetical protein FLONG3_4699 [Fusarium longipes]
MLTPTIVKANHALGAWPRLPPQPVARRRRGQDCREFQIIMTIVYVVSLTQSLHPALRDGVCRELIRLRDIRRNVNLYKRLAAKAAEENSLEEVFAAGRKKAKEEKAAAAAAAAENEGKGAEGGS